MKVYTYSRARQQLATLLKEASRQGRVQIRRRDGSIFEVSTARGAESALDVPGLSTSVTTAEIVSVVRASRRRGIAASLPNKRMQQPVRPARRLLKRQAARRPARS